jgi:hypothetical protein
MSDNTTIESLLVSRLEWFPLATAPSRDDGGELAAVRELCDGTTSLGDLLVRMEEPALLVDVLDSLLWFEEPLTLPDTATERCLLLSTDPSQPYLSMGGYLLNRYGLLDCVNVVCFSRTATAPISDELPTTAEGLAAERDAANVRGRIAGVRNVFLELPELAVLQMTTAADDRRQRDESFRRWLKMLLYRCIDEHAPSDIFAPAALAKSLEQRYLFEAVLQIFEDGYFPDVRFHLYETFPEAAQHLSIDAFLASFENAYVRVKPWFDDVTFVTDRKKQLLDVDRRSSTASESRMRAIGERNATLERKPAGSVAERFWELGLTFGTD